MLRNMLLTTTATGARDISPSLSNNECLDKMLSDARHITLLREHLAVDK